MKISSRNQLLKESDKFLFEIRKEIRKKTINKKLNESIAIKKVFTKIVDAITSSIFKWIINAEQKKKSELWVEMPYLLGIDLITSKNIDVNHEDLKNLENLMQDFYYDVKQSPELKRAISKLIDDATNRRRYTPSSIGHSREQEKSDYAHKQLVYTTVKPIVKKILKLDKYSNFDKIVMDEIQKGVTGLTPEQYRDILERYFLVLFHRVSDYVRRYDVRISPFINPIDAG